MGLHWMVKSVVVGVARTESISITITRAAEIARSANPAIRTATSLRKVIAVRIATLNNHDNNYDNGNSADTNNNINNSKVTIMMVSNQGNIIWNSKDDSSRT